MNTTIKKPVYKRIWFWVGGLFLFFIVIAMITPRNESTTPAAEQTPVEQTTVEQIPTEQTPVEQTTAEPEDAGITMENFNKIADGMKKADVDKLLGEEGELSSSAGAGEYKTEIFTYKKGVLRAKVVTVTFQNDKVIGKAQIGL